MIKVPDRVVEELLATYALKPKEIEYLAGGRPDSDGVAYSCEYRGQESVFKILAVSDKDPHGVKPHQERLKFVHFLGEREAPIVFPRECPNGELFVCAHHGEHTFLGYMMKRVKGVHLPAEKWTDEFVQRWGQAVGRMHRLTQEYPRWQYSLDENGKRFMGWEEEWEGFYNWCKDPEVKEKWAWLRSQLVKLPLSRQVFGFIHNDPHIENILVAGDELFILDFDVANYHWFACDIAIALQSVLFAQSGGMERPLTAIEPIRFFLENFLAGYRQENAFDSDWLVHIDLFISYRRILLFTVMQDWLAEKPDLRQTWKQQILENPRYITERLL